MRLNLGCGDLRRDDCVNVDLREDVADVVADVTRLPFPNESVDEIIALDLLEHFPAFRTSDVLDEWSRVLKPGGRLTVKVPNMFELARRIVDGRGVTMTIRNIMGGHRYGPEGAWDTHHHNFTGDTLTNALALSGFQVLKSDTALNMTFVSEKQ